MRLSMMSMFACLLVACPAPTPVPPAPDADASGVPDAAPLTPTDGATPTLDDCSRACARLSTLGCPEALTPDGGRSCYEVCTKAEATGKFSLNPKCVAGAASKDALFACGTVRCKP